MDHLRRGNGRLDHGGARLARTQVRCHGTRQRTAVVRGWWDCARIDRRRVSVRWFSGTILTGLCGAALMGGAVFAALDGEAHFAANPERVEASRGALGGRADSAQERPPAAGRRNQHRPPGHPRDRDDQGRRPRSAAGAAVRRDRQQPGAVDDRTVRQNPALQSAADARQHAARTKHPPPRRASTRRPTRRSPSSRAISRSSLPRLKLAALVPMDEVLGKVRDAANCTGSVPPKFAAGEHRSRQARLRRRMRLRPLCRLRGADRARKHHAAAEDREPGDRRQQLERAQHRR